MTSCGSNQRSGSLSSGSCPDGSENVDGKVVVVITGERGDRDSDDGKRVLEMAMGGDGGEDRDGSGGHGDGDGLEMVTVV